ncbi:hypothetical protein WH835_16420 [Raoultella planticola]|uniref:hypothetical protein n=1 Tax=Raoultella planticola TaxID=575 RepID=UPI00339C4CAA
MGSFIAIACVIWLLYKGVKMLARTLYKTEPISAKPDRDAWGRKEGEGPLYRRVNRATKDEDDEGLFQSINRRQQATAEEKDVSASAAFYQSREWRALRYQALKIWRCLQRLRAFSGKTWGSHPCRSYSAPQ